MEGGRKRRGEEEEEGEENRRRFRGFEAEGESSPLLPSPHLVLDQQRSEQGEGLCYDRPPPHQRRGVQREVQGPPSSLPRPLPIPARRTLPVPSPR